MTSGSTFSIIIPSHNGGELTVQCVRQLIENVRPDDQIIVVDNGSRDGTAQYLETMFKDRLELFVHSRPKGFARACNIGAMHACGEYLIFLNQDLFIDETTLSAARTAVEHHPDSIIGALIYEPAGRKIQHLGGIVLPNGITIHAGRGETDDTKPSSSLIRCDYVTGAFLIISREIFNKLDGFDVRFGPAYFEETDLCFRAAVMDHSSLVIQDITARHFEAQTSGTESLKYAFRYHLNRLRFIAKHYTFRALISTYLHAERAWWHTPLPHNARRGARLAYLLMMLELPRWMWQRMRVKPQYSPQEVAR